MGLSTWKTTVVTVPSSTGSVAYTPAGWGSATPSALIFYGTNFLTEDSCETGDGLGLFRGMACPKWDDAGVINEQAACVITTPRGNAHAVADDAISMLNTGGGVTVLYAAALTSFDAGGFTLNWTTAAAGGYKVVVVALFDITNIGSRIGMYNGGSYDPGWKAGSSLLHGCWGGTPISGTDRTQDFYGGGAYPTTNHLNWSGCGATLFCLPTAPGGGQANVELWAGMNPSTIITAGGHFTGPFLVTSNIVAYPSGGGNSFVIGGDSDDGGMVVWWDDEDSEGFHQNPAQDNGDTSTKTGLPFAPGLLLGYTCSNEPLGQGSVDGVVLRGALGFGVVTPDFQWCATVDGRASQGGFQSFQRGIADCVDGTNVHTGTVELTDDGFVITTEEDTATADGVAWHAFGHPTERTMWIPHIYRMVIAKS